LAASFAAVPQEEPENLAAAFVSAQKEWLDREEAKSRKGYREKRGSHRHQSSDRRGGQEGLESETAVQAVEDFLKQLKRLQGRVVVNKHTVSVQPFSVPETGHLRIVYEGIPVCGWKHKLQPSQQLALTWKEQDYQQAVSFAADDERVIRYLKGETLLTDTAYKGNVLVCVDGFGLGWAQGSGNGTLKNRYYPGWRYQ
jgi:NOL1/NOP2/fmu family ribosome biogenesis protein